MAETQDALRKRLRRESSCWADFYRGTREELINAGLVVDGEFPGDPGRRRHTVRIKEEGYSACGDRLQVMRHAKTTNRFNVTVWLREDEANARRAKERVVEDAAQAIADERRDLDWMPESKEEFRKRMLRYIRSSMRVPTDMLDPFAASGYRFSKESLDSLQDALDDAIDDFAALAEVKFSETRRQAYVTSIKARTARADPAFAQLLSTITSGEPAA